LGKIMSACTRDAIDVAARFGGEEFVILFPETDLQQARIFADQINNQLREHEFEVEGKKFNVTQSVGIAQVNDGNGELALRVADENLYRAKNNGRNQTVGSVVPPLQEPGKGKE
jgi:diguanylate cyclase (GGDEF)-like protein